METAAKRAISDTFDIPFQERTTEIDQKSKLQITKAQVGKDLLKMYFRKRFHRFYFHQDCALDDEVGPETFFKDLSTEAYRDRNLPFYIQSVLPNSITQQYFIDRFEQPGSEVAVQAERAINDSTGDFVVTHFPQPIFATLGSGRCRGGGICSW